MTGSGKVTENTGSFIACAALEFPATSKSMVAQRFPKWWALDNGEVSTGTNHLGFRCVKAGGRNQSIC
jgi:hypothetical protein